MTRHTFQNTGLIACLSCDLLHQEHPLRPGEEACCVRCGEQLYRLPHGGLDTPLALFLTAAILFLLTSLFPLLTMQWNGRELSCNVITGSIAFFTMGMESTALLVLLTSGVIPLLTILAALWILIPLRLQRQPWHGHWVLRTLQRIMPWGMLGVYLLGMLVAMIKLMDLATIIPGPAFYAFVGLLLSAEAGRSALEPRLLWLQLEPQP